MAKRTSPTEIRRYWIVAGLVALGVAIVGPRPGPDRLESLLSQAILAERNGEPSAALDAVEAAIEFEPALASLHGPATRLALDAGSPERADSHLAAARLLPGPGLDLTCLAAETSLRLGRSSPDLEVRAECLDTPTRTALWVAAHLQADDVVGAIETLRAWLDEHPEDLMAWEDLAGLTIATEPEQARPIILRALQHHPGGSPVLDGLLGLAQDLDVTPAATTLARAGELFASNGRWAVAAAAWQHVLTLQPEFPQVRAYLGLALLRQGRDGLPLIDQAATDATGDPIVRGLYGQALLESADLEGALRELDAAAGLDPGNPAIAAAHADALSRSGDYQAASMRYQDAAALAPDEPVFWLLLAEFSLQNGYEPGTLGLPAARNAAVLDPDNPSAIGALGFAWHLAGDGRLAERLLRRSLEMDPLDATGWYRYGLVLVDLGRVAEGSDAFRSAMALDPDGDVGGLAVRTLESIEANLP